MNRPKVYFVGAGPGDPGLITRRGAQLLRRADCIIYDGLVNPAILDDCSLKAERICVRKRTGDRPFTQDQINQIIVQKARQYPCVVRLKGGDPGIFGRAAEEIQSCLKADIRYEMVPGVTAATAAAQYAGFFLTDREHSSQVIFVTGQEAPDKEQSAIDWDLLARFNGTIVFYMGMGRLDRITQTLIEKGKDAKTPAIAIQHASLPAQRLAQGSLETIAQNCCQTNLQPPAIVVIGPAAVYRKETDWFTKRPLFGKTVLITRDARGNRALAERISELGGQPIPLDAIAVVDLTDTPESKAIVPKIKQFDWVIFTSGHGIACTIDLLRKQNCDLRAFGSCQIVCIGEETARRLNDFGLRADFVPSEYVSNVLADELAHYTNLKGKKILLLRSAIAPEDLPDRLKSHGALVEQIHVYTVQPTDRQISADQDIIKLIQSSQVDWITFTSSSTVQSFLNRIGADILRQNRVKIASIGPITSRRLQENGLKIAVEARPHTTEGLIEAMVNYHD
jgi:uroporphyrinogen III methyltransferase/synthase